MLMDTEHVTAKSSLLAMVHDNDWATAANSGCSPPYLPLIVLIDFQSCPYTAPTPVLPSACCETARLMYALLRAVHIRTKR